MNNKVKEFYYIFKCHMNKYIKSGESYYRIVGFSYSNERDKGFFY